jgi:hypothetical protein
MWIQRRFGGLGAVLLVVAGALAAAVAQGRPAAAEEIFTVAGVEIDATGGNVVEARDKAIAMGQAKALGELWRNIVPSDQISRIPPVSGGALADFVEDFSVTGERRSDVRYIATLAVRFRPNVVRDFLSDHRIAFAETRARPVVVLPVFGEGAQAVLWDDPNPWRDVWLDRADLVRLVPLVTPLGDLSDMAAVDVERALGGDALSLRAIAGLYDAERVLLAQARLSGDTANGQGVLELSTRLFAQGPDAGSSRETLRQQAPDSEAEFLARVAERIDRRIQEDWKRAHLLDFSRRNQLSATVPIANLAEWISVQQRLAAEARILHSEVRSVSRSQAVVELAFVGDPDELARALAQADLQLVQKPSGAAGTVGWEIRPGGYLAPSQPVPESGAPLAVPQ